MAETSEIIRTRKGFKNLTMVRRMGNLYGGAKITDRDVEEIRARYSVGDITQEELAAEYGVDRTNISHIVCGRSWRKQK